MVVGYALGNKDDSEDEILVVGEDDPNVITYSRSLMMTLSRACRNNCPYCGFHRHDTLAVPYSTIKMTKTARSNGVREVLYLAGERPDKSPQVRANLDLWGFKSFLDYMYTVCELGFLEGLIPVLDVGFLSPIEYKRLSEVCAVVKVSMDSVDPSKVDKIYPQSPGKKMDMRLKNMAWAMEAGIPVSAGILVGIGETEASRRTQLNQIAQLQKKYGLIHEVLIQNFVPEKGTPMASKAATTQKQMLKAVDAARSILPDEVPISIYPELNEELGDFISAGVRDLGRLFYGPRPMFSKVPRIEPDQLHETVAAKGFRLQQRFPLRQSFIRAGHYSNKLGQVFDSYRYKLKKLEQEKLKLAKS